MNYVDKVRSMCEADPTFKARAIEGWNTVCDKIHAHALKIRPKLRSFEVHHMLETARARYLESLAEGGSTDFAVSEALNRVKVPR